MQHSPFADGLFCAQINGHPLVDAGVGARAPFGFVVLIQRALRDFHAGGIAGRPDDHRLVRHIGGDGGILIYAVQYGYGISRRFRAVIGRSRADSDLLGKFVFTHGKQSVGGYDGGNVGVTLHAPDYFHSIRLVSDDLRNILSALPLFYFRIAGDNGNALNAHQRGIQFGQLHGIQKLYDILRERPHIGIGADRAELINSDFLPSALQRYHFIAGIFYNIQAVKSGLRAVIPLVDGHWIVA